GRVLRALLAIYMPRLRATEVAVMVGTVAAVGLLIAGLLIPAFSMILVAVVVWLLGQAELAAIRVAERREEYERREREFYDDPEDDVEEPWPADSAAALAARRFSGLAWDADRRVWVQWVNGVPVRDIPT